MKKIILILIGLIFIHSVSGFIATTFNNSLSEENLTFTGDENITRYLAVPSSVSKLVTSVFDLTGYFNTDPNLTSYYTLNESSGTRVDLLGKYNITISGGSLNGVGIINNSFQGDGTNWGNISEGVFGNRSALSMSFWFNSSRIWDCSGGCKNIMTAQKGIDLNFQLASCDQTSNDISVVFNNQTCRNLGLNTSTSKWQHIVLTATSNSNYTIYVNNTKVISFYAGNFSNLSGIGLGWSPGGSGNYLQPNQSIDELAIWNRELTTSDISLLYNNHNANPYSNITALNNYIIIGNTAVITLSGNGTEQITQTLNVKPQVNSYLSTCSYISSVCYVPFTFHSYTAGTLGYSNLIFSNNGLNENYQVFNSEALESTTESFSINISYDQSLYTSSLGTLVYNNTRYAGTTSGSAGSRIFTSSLITPAVNSNVNKSFYWEVALTNSSGTSYFNSSFNNQSVLNLGIDNCSVNTVVLLNYTLYNEDTRILIPTTVLGNISTEVTATIGSFDKTQISGVSFNKTNTNPISVCISRTLLNTTSYRLDSTIKYSSADRVTEYHNIRNRSITNSTIYNKIDLYDLDTTNSQEFLITYKDFNFIPVSDAVIYVDRQYLDIGQFLNIEAPLTDNDGRTIAHLVLNDEVYNFNVTKNDRQVALFSNVRAFCSNIATGDCRINLNALSQTGQPNQFITVEGVSLAPSYNNNTRIYQVIFTSLDGSDKEINITIWKYDSYLNQTICSNTLTSSSGTLQCTIPSAYQNDTALAKIYVDGVEVSTSVFPVSSTSSVIPEPSKYVLAFLLIVTLPLLAFASPMLTVVFYFVGLILAGLLFLIDYSGFFGATSSVLWFFIAGAIILWKINNRGGKAF